MKSLRYLYEQWLFNASMSLFERNYSMCYLAHVVIGKLILKHKQSKEQEQPMPLEPGITGMYD